MREWIEEGFFPEGFWAGGGPQLEALLDDPDAGINRRRKAGVPQQRVTTQLGRDGRVVRTVVTGGAAGGGLPSPPAHEALQPGLASGLHAQTLAALTAAAVSGGGAGAGAAAAAALGRPPLAPGAGRMAGKGGGRGRTAGSDEDGSDHFNAAAVAATDNDAAHGAHDTNDGSPPATSAEPRSGSDAMLMLLGEAALADAGAATAATAGAGGCVGEIAAAAADSRVGAVDVAASAVLAAQQQGRRKRTVLEVGDNDELSEEEEVGVWRGGGGGGCSGGLAKRGTAPAPRNSSRQPAAAAVAYLEDEEAAHTQQQHQQQRQPRKRQALAVAIPSAAAANPAYLEAAAAQHAAPPARPSSNPCYRNGGGSASEHMQQLAPAHPPAGAGGDAQGAGGLGDDELQAVMAATAAALAQHPKLSTTDWSSVLDQQLLWHVHQQQAQQCMAAPLAAMQHHAGGACGAGGQHALLMHPCGFTISPMSGHYDPSALAPTPACAASWDAALHALHAAACGGGPGDLLHQMSLSLGLPPPVPLPQQFPPPRRSTTQLPAAPPLAPPAQIALELASPRADPPHRARHAAREPRRWRSSGAGAYAAGAAPSPGAAAAAALPPLSPKTAADLSRLDEWQASIEAAERAMGRDHPAVGRAWMDLAKALQAAALHSDRARMATKRAFDVVLAATKSGPAGESFRYLLSRYAGGRQQQQAVAVAGQQQVEQQAAEGLPESAVAQGEGEQRAAAIAGQVV